MKHLHKLLLLTLIISAAMPAQTKLPPGGIFVDKNGIMKWQADSSEVALFGVNYTAPFAYSYRSLKKLNLNLKQAIDIDVRQMKRLGFNAFRVHVWDREISDSSGTLIVNEHLDLFDYLLKRLADNGIKTILTPIAWWGTGYPEPDIKTGGFSDRYSKTELITIPAAREAQKKYLKAFMLHKNKYSGYAYKDDPSVIAVEIINEPKHPADTSLVTSYINEMAAAVRSSGFSKPVFCNISENWSSTQAPAVARGNIDGITFQWYPTALVHNHMLSGNYLLNVDDYRIPSENVPGFSGKAKMVYEFDAADIGASYMYPAMVRSFRKAGMQFAAMFSYDPTQIAWSNTEYPTHYMNLLYTPKKAVSLMIAAKAFMHIPLYHDYGRFPANTKFGPFRVSSDKDLSEMNTPEEFYYSNNTDANPADIQRLRHIAGCGSSPVVSFSGTGAYFLDKIKEGVWILEVNPDAVWIRDPFGKNSLTREVARLYYSHSAMKINLPGLPEDFNVYSLSAGTVAAPVKAAAREIIIKPGIYLISGNKLALPEVNEYKKGIPAAPAIYTPGKEKEIEVINHTAASAFDNGKPVRFRFTIASAGEIQEASLCIRRPGWRGFETVKLAKTGKYDYEASVSSAAVKSGLAEYCVCVTAGGEKITFPGSVKGSPEQWDFSAAASWHAGADKADERLWSMQISEPGSPVVLFSPLRDRERLLYPFWTPAQKFFADYKFSRTTGGPVFRCRIEQTGTQAKPFMFMNNVSGHIAAGTDELKQYGTVVFRGRTSGKAKAELKIDLLMKDGRCMSAVVRPGEEMSEFEIPLGSFHSTQRFIIPDSYPLFLNDRRIADLGPGSGAVDLSQLDFIQVQVLTPASSETKTTEFEIEKIYIK